MDVYVILNHVVWRKAKRVLMSSLHATKSYTLLIVLRIAANTHVTSHPVYSVAQRYISTLDTRAK